MKANKVEKTISKETLNFIYCLETLNNVFEQTARALSEAWGESSVEEMMEKQFCNKFDELQEVIESFTTRCIRWKLGLTNCNEL